jgi:hypothetical protein
MVSLLGIIVGISAVLAIIVSSAVIGVCLLIGWLTGNGPAARGFSPRGTHGGGRHGSQPGPFPGQPQPQERYRAGRLLAPTGNIADFVRSGGSGARE